MCNDIFGCLDFMCQNGIFFLLLKICLEEALVDVCTTTGF